MRGALTTTRLLLLPRAENVGVGEGAEKVGAENVGAVKAGAVNDEIVEAADTWAVWVPLAVKLPVWLSGRAGFGLSDDELVEVD
jgi:hypothetical protein